VRESVIWTYRTFGESGFVEAKGRRQSPEREAPVHLSGREWSVGRKRENNKVIKVDEVEEDVEEGIGRAGLDRILDQGL